MLGRDDGSESATKVFFHWFLTLTVSSRVENHYQTNFCEQKTYHSLEIYKPWSSEIIYSKKSLCLLIFVFYCSFFFVTKNIVLANRFYLYLSTYLCTSASLAWLVDFFESVNNQKLQPWGWKFTSPSRSRKLDPSVFHIFLSAILNLNAPAKSWWQGYHQLAQC